MILGLESSGSSCISGVLYHLGVFFGNSLTGYYGNNPEKNCGFEDFHIANLLQNNLAHIESKKHIPHISQKLEELIVQNQENSCGSIFAIKFPFLCAADKYILEICPLDKLYVVNCVRPINDSITSLIKRDGARGERANTIVNRQKLLHKRKSSLINKLDNTHVLNVDYYDLLKNTEIIIKDKISPWLNDIGININHKKQNKAIEYVKPNMQHVGPQKFKNKKKFLISNIIKKQEYKTCLSICYNMNDFCYYDIDCEYTDNIKGAMFSDKKYDIIMSDCYVSPKYLKKKLNKNGCLIIDNCKNETGVYEHIAKSKNICILLDISNGILIEDLSKNRILPIYDDTKESNLLSTKYCSSVVVSIHQYLHNLWSPKKNTMNDYSKVHIEHKDINDWYKIVFNNYSIRQNHVQEKHLGGHNGFSFVDLDILQYLYSSNINSFLDIGCGPGWMTNEAKAIGMHSVGIDGDIRVYPDILHDFITGPLFLDRVFDVGWSVEFLEHVEEKYLDNIFSAFFKCKKIICTAANIGKGGYHHVNCRNLPYWLNEFSKRGFLFDENETKKIKQLTTIEHSISKNFMVFVNGGLIND